jgi:hypothetical protein
MFSRRTTNETANQSAVTMCCRKRVSQSPGRERFGFGRLPMSDLQQSGTRSRRRHAGVGICATW